MNNKFIIIGVVAILCIALLAWLFIESSKPLPGERLLQDGRNHVSEGSKVDYKFNPPTSGDHYASWITKGFYEEPRADGNLVHSQEHGYIIFWYDCERKVTSDKGQLTSWLIKPVYAHEEATPSATTKVNDQGTISMTGGSEGSPSAHFEDMPKSFSDGSCDGLKKELKEVLNKFGPHKLIAIPRPNMGKRLVLTAWGKTQELVSVEHDKIKKFIDAYRDNGPEHTIEP